MSEPSMATATPTRNKQPRQPWDQQPEEKALWYARFLRFVALGPSRSVSLLATGRRNAYPVPAHWPIQAKQWSWRERAKAFDEAAKANPRIIQVFNALLTVTTDEAATSTGDLHVEAGPLLTTVLVGGYLLPPPPDEDEATKA